MIKTQKDNKVNGIRHRLCWVVVVLSFIIYHLSFSACARMGSPDGGWYDDTPPRVVGSSPADGGTEDLVVDSFPLPHYSPIPIADSSSSGIVGKISMNASGIRAGRLLSTSRNTHSVSASANTAPSLSRKNRYRRSARLRR